MEYFPLVHAVHDEDPKFDTNPFGQALHGGNLVLDHQPSGHTSLQSSWLVDPTDTVLYVEMLKNRAHDVHVDDPGALENVPILHKSHDED